MSTRFWTRLTTSSRRTQRTSFGHLYKRADNNGHVRPRRDGREVRCRDCVAEYSAAHYRRRRDEMIASQMGVCVICLNAPAVHVDHCHETGRVRGVLCFNCNSAIGKLGDDPDTVRRATAYLEGNAWKPILVAPGVYRLPS
ncbi:endonuclease VII domain-containing protein [Streptomyces sp. NPDC002795]|uniref:endonuclease VII domain-containing protein n=1 Tax=Streptomyces sp. NPDC002795 TaxID=3364665 RepID=UPI00368A1B31